jgi:tetratricopeptide (TPR) repeat protein
MLRFLRKLLGVNDPRRAAAMVARGVELARAGDVRGALRAYQDAVDADDTYALGHLNVALALQDLFNDERASLDPEEHDARLAEMAAALRRSSELDPGLAPAHRALGFVERAARRFPEARDAFRAYVELAPDKDPHLERVNAALEEVTVKAAVAAAIARAVDLAEDVDEVEEALRQEVEVALRDALVHAPDRADGWWALGILRRAAGDAVGATEALGKALAADPTLVAAHKELATLHFRARDVTRALPHARAAYESDPTNPALVCNLGVCHLALGDVAEARDYILIAKGLAPKDPIVQDCLRALAEAEAAVGGAA